MMVDAHVHAFPRFAGMSQGRPVVSDRFGKVRHGNAMQQFLPPSFADSSSTVEMLLAHLDASGVDRAVLLSNVLYGYHNEYSLKAVRDYPDRVRAVALVDMFQGADAVAELDELLGMNEFLGMKIETASAFQCHPETDLDDKILAPIWAACDDLGTSVFLHLCRDRDLPAWMRVADRYRNITYIVCHAGAETTLSSAGQLPAFSELIRFCREHQGVFLDVSSLPHYLGREDPPFQKTRAVTHQLCGELGAERLMWGTDYPGMLSMATYQQLVDVIAEHPQLSGQERDLIMGGVAAGLFWD